MLKLTEIKMNEDEIEAYYTPESSGIKAKIALNIGTHDYQAEIIDEYGSYYARMAANGLIRCLEELQSGKRESLPSERVVMWY